MTGAYAHQRCEVELRPRIDASPSVLGFSECDAGPHVADDARMPLHARRRGRIGRIAGVGRHSHRSLRQMKVNEQYAGSGPDERRDRVGPGTPLPSGSQDGQTSPRWPVGERQNAQTAKRGSTIFGALCSRGAITIWTSAAIKANQQRAGRTLRQVTGQSRTGRQEREGEHCLCPRSRARTATARRRTREWVSGIPGSTKSGEPAVHRPAPGSPKRGACNGRCENPWWRKAKSPAEDEDERENLTRRLKYSGGLLLPSCETAASRQLVCTRSCPQRPASSFRMIFTRTFETSRPLALCRGKLA